MRLGWLARLLLALALSVPMAQAASMRCGSALINEGQSAAEVMRTCGEPTQRQRTEPALAANGELRQGAVSVEEWIYGPQSGLYRHLKFIDGRLVQIGSTR